MNSDIMQDPWTIVRGEYFPPDGELVWTSDGKMVRKGTWHFQPLAPLEESAWTDEGGNPIAVTHWCGLDESPGGEPALPPPVKSIKEIIAKQKQINDDEEEGESWKNL